MQMQRTVDGASMPPRPDSPIPSAQRSGRRASARRASNRRATARRRKQDVEGHIIAYLKDHPRSTAGAVAKAVNASRATIAARMSHVDARRRRRAADEH